MIPTELNWSGRSGSSFADMFTFGPEELDAGWERMAGIRRTALSRVVLDKAGLSPFAEILEVGCNAGNQLVLLRSMGYSCLAGIDICEEAILRARSRYLDVVVGSARALPWKDGRYNLVFTSGVLSHVGPEHVGEAVRECIRVTRRWFWGCEYFALPPQYAQAPGREAGYLWPADYKALFMHQGMKLVHSLRLPGPECLESFLMEKE